MGKDFVVIRLEGDEGSIIELKVQWRERNGWKNTLLIAVALQWCDVLESIESECKNLSLYFGTD